MRPPPAPGVHAGGAAYDSEDAMRLAFERVAAFNDTLQSSDALVTAGGLAPPEEAVTVDATAAPDDDAARALAGQASYACGQPVELRRLQG